MLVSARETGLKGVYGRPMFLLPVPTEKNRIYINVHVSHKYMVTIQLKVNAP